MNEPRRVVAIVQARMRSERLPGKVLADIGGSPVLEHVLRRVRRAARLDDVWVACSTVIDDDPLVPVVERCGAGLFRGDEHDVLGRFAGAARAARAGVVVRITADCPMIDPGIIDAVIDLFGRSEVDFASNTLQRSFPDGLDVEVFSRAALDRADHEAQDPFLRGHVTPYIHGRLKTRLPWGGFTNAQHVGPADFSQLRWTLDEADDLEFFRRLIPSLPASYDWLDAIAALMREPVLLRINAGHRLHEGTTRDLARSGGGSNAPRRYDASNAYFERAVRSIPLASQTFSKSHQQWVKGAAPLFLRSGRGCRVTDLDGNGYIDYVLGLLPIVLGYRDPDVDGAIIAQLDQGITFPLAHPSEAELAERLIRLIPCAERVRFGKNGSDATTAAVRLARAHTGRPKVAVCGYHGWHDWYIGTTTRHRGVPAEVRALSTTFPFNDADALERLLQREPDSYAAVILEPDGAYQPAPGFLARLREITAKHGVILIFDEIITGFRMHLGGAQAHHGVFPDLAAVGKAMGNGMPISAVVGRAEIMDGMNEIFFSSTFGGEALSIAAAIATLDKLEREDVVARLWRLGARLRDETNAILMAHGFEGVVAFAGEGWWPRIRITNPPVDNNLFISLWRQEFNANGLILGASFNLSLAHDDDRIVAETLAAIDRSARSVRDAVDGPDPRACLRGEPFQPTFSVR